MKTVIHILLSIIIFFPLLIFFVTYYICKRRNLPAVRSFGIASDQTTVWLFMSVPLSISGLWQFDAALIVVMIAIVIALLFTFVDWRTKKEIVVKALLRKIWRFYFLTLIVTYIVIWVLGLIHNIMQFVTIS